MKRGTVRIEAPHFVAGIDYADGVVTHTAPILAYMRRWSAARVWEYCLTRRWKAERIAEPSTERAVA